MPQEKSEKRHQNRYTIAFKMKLVEEIENGLISQCAASRLYGVPQTTIFDWIKRYGYNAQIDKVVYVMTNEEERELIRLRKEVQRLTRALDESHLKNLALESLIEIAEETYDPDLKKNIGTRLAEELTRKLKPSGLKDQD